MKASGNQETFAGEVALCLSPGEEPRQAKRRRGTGAPCRIGRKQGMRAGAFRGGGSDVGQWAGGPRRLLSSLPRGALAVSEERPLHALSPVAFSSHESV